MPTICKISLDAEEYRKELAAVVAETRAAQEKMAAKSMSSAPAVSADAVNASNGNTRNISVAAEVSGLEDVQKLAEAVNALPSEKEVRIATTAATRQTEKKVDDIQKKVNKLPAQKNVDIKISGNDPGKTITVPKESIWKRSTQGIRECWKEMTNLQGGAKQMVSALVAGGGLIGVAMAGIQGAIKCVVALYDTWIQKGKEAAQVHVDAASAIGEAAANNDRLKASSKDAVAQLGQLASAEKLSNAQKSQAITLIGQLTKQYGDLGVKVNEATGRIEGLSEALVAKQEKDSRKKISALQAQIKDLQAANQQENKNIRAGVPLLFGLQLGGEKESLEAAERIKQNTAAIMEKQLALQEEKKRLAEAAKKQLQKTQVENAALEEQKRERDDQTAYTKADNDFNRARTADEKIANRQNLINGEQSRNDALHRKTEAAKALMDKYAPGSAEANAQKYEDAKKAYLQNAADQAKSDEKIANWNEQINQIQHEQAEGKRKLTEQSDFELKYQKLIAAGEYDKAAALKQEYDLKQQGLKLTEDEKKKLLDQKKELQDIAVQKELAAGDDEIKIQQLLLAGEYEKAQLLKMQIDARKQGRTMSEEEARQRMKQKKELQDIAVQKELAAGEDELKVQQLLLAGEYEKAQLLRMQIDARKQGRDMGEEEVRQRMKQKQAAGSMTLAGNLREQAQSLKWSSMEAAGQGEEAARLKALRDAEKTKGGKLTEAETKLVEKLSSLQFAAGNAPQAQVGDLSIKTNSLTSRGGFQGGAYVAQKDEVNKAISSNVKQACARMQAIETYLDKISTGIKNGGKVTGI